MPFSLRRKSGQSPGGRAGNRPSSSKKSRRARRKETENGEPSAAPLTASNFLLGSIDYMAPEQAADPHSADIRADVYSLGCTLFFLLTGQPPFPHGTLAEKIESHAKEPPPAIDEFRNDVPAELSLALARMLAKSPAERYQTPAEVAAALAPLAGVMRLPAPTRAWWHGRRWRWIAAMVGVLLCGLAVAGWQWGWHPLGRPDDEAENSSAEAQRLYREGVFLLAQRRESQTTLAIRRLQRAVELAPDFALAYAKLADAYNLCGDYGWEKADVVFPKAKEAAQKALAQNDKLAEAHLALAFVLDTYDGDSRAAEKEFLLALKLKPKLADAHHWYAWFLVQQGRPKEAAKHIEQAQKLGPEQVIIANNAGKMAYLQRNYALAVKKHKYALQLSPDFRKAHRDLAMVYAETGKLDGALGELNLAKGVTDDDRDLAAVRAYAYARNGQAEKARDLLTELEPRPIASRWRTRLPRSMRLWATRTRRLRGCSARFASTPPAGLESPSIRASTVCTAIHDSRRWGLQPERRRRRKRINLAIRAKPQAAGWLCRRKLLRDVLLFRLFRAAMVLLEVLAAFGSGGVMNFGLGQRFAQLLAHLADAVAQRGGALEFQLFGRGQHLGL